jgi:hypothetical protein
MHGVTLIANPHSKLDWPAAIAEFRTTVKLVLSVMFTAIP